MPCVFPLLGLLIVVPKSLISRSVVTQKKSLELQALRICSNMMPQQLDEVDQGDSFAVLLIAF